jgi:hypothetical protein
MLYKRLVSSRAKLVVILDAIAWPPTLQVHNPGEERRTRNGKANELYQLIFKLQTV